jgi:putative membrane protein
VPSCAASRISHDRPWGHPRFEVKVTATDHFSWLRTRLAVELTIMAWLITAVSLIGFGFAIVQFFERMR